MRKRIPVLATAKLPDGMLEVLRIECTNTLDVRITHRFNGSTHTTTVKQDTSGAAYFHAHSTIIYIDELRKVRTLN